MLYAVWRGISANRDYAAYLFGIASMQGHFEAQKMLETIEIKTTNAPPYMMQAIAPEKPRDRHI